MKPVRFLFIFSFVAVFLFLIFLISCKKDPYEIGISLLPPSDTLNVKTVDTSTLVAYSVIQDSIRSDETTTSMLGSIMDPVMGRTTASFFTQVRLSIDNPDFGTNPVLDSLVLLLHYKSIYGDSNTYQNVRVYEISQDIIYDSSYYSTQSIGTYGTLLANHTFKPNLKDSLVIQGKKLKAHFRVNLSNLTNYLGNKLLYAPSAALENNTNFIPFMKGLYIQSSPVYYKGALISFDPTGLFSKLVVYFHNSTDDSLHYDFLINTLCARFNQFDHHGYNDANPDFKKQVLQHDSLLGKNTLYLQGLGGVKTRIRLPYINSLKNIGKFAINDAELSIKNAETDTTLAPPPSLTLVKVDSSGKIGFLIDEDEGQSYFGGSYDKKTRTYKFRITRHIQQILLGKEKNYDLFLMVNNPVKNVLIPNRIVTVGTQPDLPVSASDRMKLKIVYTKLY